MKIIRLGEKTIHEGGYQVDRPFGYPFYLMLLLHTPGRFMADGKWQDVPADTIIVFKPGQPHQYGYVPEEGKKVAYGDSWLHVESDIPLLGEHFPYGKPVSVASMEEYHVLFHLLTCEYFGTAGNKEEAMGHLLSALLCRLVNEAGELPHSELYYKMLKVRSEFYSEPGKEWNIGEICEKLNISEGYFHTAYKQYFGTTCMGDVIEARIGYACEYLDSTEKSIEEIAELCGYRNTEHFIRQFKKRKNKTPLQYRRRNLVRHGGKDGIVSQE